MSSVIAKICFPAFLQNDAGETRLHASDDLLLLPHHFRNELLRVILFVERGSICLYNTILK